MPDSPVTGLDAPASPMSPLVEHNYNQSGVCTRCARCDDPACCDFASCPGPPAPAGYAAMTALVDVWCSEFGVPVDYSTRKVLVDRIQRRRP